MTREQMYRILRDVSEGLLDEDEAMTLIDDELDLEDLN